jgi:hypothetical protein
MKKPDLNEGMHEICKLMTKLSKTLEKKKSLFRIQINYTLGEGFEFKAIVDSKVKKEECRLLLSQYFFEDEEGHLLRSFKEVFETGDLCDDGWVMSYEKFDNLKNVATNNYS